jgi:capsular polysaccharide biosynthesis protein
MNPDLAPADIVAGTRNAMILRAQLAAARTSAEQSAEQHVITAEMGANLTQTSHYDNLIANLQSQAAVDAASVGSITQYAVAATGPTGPGLLVAIVLGLLVGAILGAGIVIFSGLRTNEIATPSVQPG